MGYMGTYLGGACLGHYDVFNFYVYIDDDIFYTPAKTPPKKKKQWMDDLLDDDKDLFGDITVDKKETVTVVAAGKDKLEETEAKKPKSGGLFDDLPLDDGGEAPLSTSDGQASNSVNGHKGEYIHMY